jgi:NADH-quinone oxidoreductase subunit N
LAGVFDGFFGNLAMFFLGIEVLSIALYILAASDRMNLKKVSRNEVFLDGIFASESFSLVIYDCWVGFDVIEISALSQSAELPVWFSIGIFVTIGMLFKSRQFHFTFGHQMFILSQALMSTLAKVVLRHFINYYQ